MISVDKAARFHYTARLSQYLPFVPTGNDRLLSFYHYSLITCFFFILKIKCKTKNAMLKRQDYEVIEYHPLQVF